MFFAWLEETTIFIVFSIQTIQGVQINTPLARWNEHNVTMHQIMNEPFCTFATYPRLALIHTENTMNAQPMPQQTRSRPYALQGQKPV